MHPCKSLEYVSTGTELLDSFCVTSLIASSVIPTGIRIGVSSYVSNVEQENFFVRLFYCQEQYGGFINNARSILFQLLGLQTSLCFPSTIFFECLAQFTIGDEVA